MQNSPYYKYHQNSNPVLPQTQQQNVHYPFVSPLQNTSPHDSSPIKKATSKINRLNSSGNKNNQINNENTPPPSYIQQPLVVQQQPKRYNQSSNYGQSIQNNILKQVINQIPVQPKQPYYQDVLKDITNPSDQVVFFPLYDPVNPVKGEVRHSLHETNGPEIKLTEEPVKNYRKEKSKKIGYRVGTVYEIEEENQRLLREIKKYRRKNDKKNFMLLEMENNIRRLIDENGILIDQNKKETIIRSEKARDVEKIYELESYLLKLNTQNANLKSILVVNGEQLDAWRQKFNDLEKLLQANAEREKEGIKAISDLESKIKILIGENSRLANLLDAKKRELNEKPDDSINISCMLGQQEEEILAWKKKCEFLEEELKENKTKSINTSILKERVQDLERKIEILIAENDKLNFLLSEMGSKSNDLEQKLDFAHDNISPEIQSTIDSFKENLLEIAQENESLSKNIKELQIREKFKANLKVAFNPYLWSSASFAENRPDDER